LLLTAAAAALAAAPAAASGVGPERSTAPLPTACTSEGAADVDASFARWAHLLRDRGSLSGDELGRRAEAVIADAFAVDAMAEWILGDRWGRTHPYDRGRFHDALVRAIRGEILPFFAGAEVLPMLRPADEPWSPDDGTVDARYWLVAGDWQDWFTLRLMNGPDGHCRIFDVKRGDRSLIRRLDDRVDRLIDDYSFEYMVAQVGDYEAVVLEDFEDDDEGSLPRGWTWRDGDNDKNKPYRVRVEDGNHYLEATDEGESVILGREIRWNLDEYPYLSFRVRVHRIPEGGDERDDRKVDSAAGLYITYKKKVFGKIPESVKYVWSSTLPVGTAVRREGIGRPWQVVFATGKDRLGEWRTFVFDLRQAYRDTFGGDPPSKPLGIGILSDANSLHSQAYADYDDIRVLRVAPPGVTSGVREKVPPIKR